ncbi:hypothetical protein R3X27_07875 [Tropicimonas sp. TH_r6]|uniref:hypothetical protein n=1 Tax=Tropicimonas sp. TH_r6 TaxID=3082085 RepID=UPI002952FB17|nr:hypothetical protein [Tropicimonas sp. TH_r6]MDV7142597.1 hypothetical protein [Tropicimonas sp. TH_r6]
MQDSKDLHDQLKRLHLHHDVHNDGVVDTERARQALERHFNDLPYIDRREDGQGYGGYYYVKRFDARNDPAALALLALYDSDEEATAYLLHVIREMPHPVSLNAPGYWDSQRHLRLKFWLPKLHAAFPPDAAARAMGKLYQALFASAPTDEIMTVLAFALVHLPEAPGTINMLRHFVGALPKRLPPDGSGTWTTDKGVISDYLNDRYEKGHRNLWPLIRDFWAAFPLHRDAGNLDKMHRLCRNEPEYHRLIDTLVRRLLATKDAQLDASIAEFFRAYLVSNVDETPFDTLHALTRFTDGKLREAALFWLAIRRRHRASTFGVLMDIAEGGKDLQWRRFAFRLAFVEYHDNVDAVGRLARAAHREKEDRSAFIDVLSGASSFAPLPDLTNERAKQAARNGNGPRWARTFSETCRKAGIDSGVRLPTGPKPAFKEFLLDIITQSLPGMVTGLLVHFTLSPGERASLRNIESIQEFFRTQRAKLEGTPRNDAGAIVSWMEDAWWDALSCFGFKGHATGITDQAFGHLLPEDMSEPAERVREFRSRLKDLWNRAYDLVSADPDLSGLKEMDTGIVIEIAERAFFILLGNPGSTIEFALKRAGEDAIQSVDWDELYGQV